MIIGSVDITEDPVQTHRDSYLLAHLSVVSVRRPFFAPGLILAAGAAAFAVSFRDLLYPEEILGFAGFAILAPLLGHRVGHIQLLSRDLRGTELAGMIWGTYGHLNRIRRQIVAAMRAETGAKPAPLRLT